MTGCEGDVSGVTGDMSPYAGDMTGVEGQPPAEMMGTEGGAMDAAFADDGSAPPPTDDPMGAAMDQADAQNVADGAEGGQGPGLDPMADMPDPEMDPGTDQGPDDDQGGGAIG